jgi:hypothetical protein
VKSNDKTPKKPRKLMNGAETGKPFTKDYQPTPEAKSKGWEAKRAEKLLTQKIIEKLTDGNNLDDFIESLITNAKMGNAKAIDVLTNGIEEQITKTETTLKLGKDLADENYV